MISFLFKGRRGAFQPAVIGLGILIFMSLVGYDFPLSFTVSSFFATVFASSNTIRAFWEDMAVNRIILRYGRVGGVFLPYSFVLVVSSFANFLILFLSFLIYNFFGFKEVIGVMVWTISSSILTTIISIIGEMARVNMEFFSMVILIPLLLGIYGFLSSESPLVFLGLMIVMGIFYTSFSLAFSDIFFEV